LNIELENGCVMSKWIERKKRRWLNGYKTKKERQPKENKKEEDIDNYAIIVYPIKCPRCGSKKVYRYKSDLPVRYYKCKNCGHNFKSIEKE